MRRTASILGFVAGLAAYLGAAQTDTTPVNDLPDPYRLEANYFKMPAGRTWGSTRACGSRLTIIAPLARASTTTTRSTRARSSRRHAVEHLAQPFQAERNRPKCRVSLFRDAEEGRHRLHRA